ncbi:uncharacterized protein LOC62_01G001621 [Vanrija pseudolonga]|uniref:CBM1 domain-containing protein n=1 Tax=Vanrija pseudolonga TaxID=143232 RepID=A0AAF0Y757_9TREE|nr:hypothetical protein LOC62_01G001621 [Vanrija pseudolonga]
MLVKVLFAIAALAATASATPRPLSVPRVKRQNGCELVCTGTRICVDPGWTCCLNAGGGISHSWIPGGTITDVSTIIESTSSTTTTTTTQSTTTTSSAESTTTTTTSSAESTTTTTTPAPESTSTTTTTQSPTAAPVEPSSSTTTAAPSSKTCKPKHKKNYRKRDF